MQGQFGNLFIALDMAIFRSFSPPAAFSLEGTNPVRMRAPPGKGSEGGSGDGGKRNPVLSLPLHGCARWDTQPGTGWLSIPAAIQG